MTCFNTRFAFLIFLAIATCFNSCIKEKEVILGDDPLKLRIETDSDGKLILKWNAIKLSNFRNYSIRVAPDSSLFFNNAIDTTLFDTEASQVRLNPNVFPLASKQYFQVELNNNSGGTLTSGKVEYTKSGVTNIGVNGNFSQILIDPSARYMVLLGSNVMSCIDVETQQVTGNIFQNLNSSQFKFSFSSQNGTEYFHFIASSNDSKVTTYQLPDLKVRDVVQTNLYYDQKFLALDNSNLYVQLSNGWPYELQLVNSSTGIVVNGFTSQGQQTSGDYQSYYLTDSANKEFVHYRPDSLIKYRVKTNNTLEKLHSVINQFPNITNAPNGNTQIRQQWEAPVFFAPLNSQGIYSSDFTKSFINPSQLIAVQNSYLYTSISRDGKYLYSLYQSSNTGQFFVEQYSLEDQKIEQVKSLGLFINIQFPFLIERPDGIHLVALTHSSLNFLKLDL